MNLNHSILPKWMFLIDAIYNGIKLITVVIWRILTLDHCSFANLFACFANLIELIELIELESIEVIFFLFLPFLIALIMSFCWFFGKNICASIKQVILHSWGIHVGVIHVNFIVINGPSSWNMMLFVRVRCTTLWLY